MSLFDQIKAHAELLLKSRSDQASTDADATDHPGGLSDSIADLLSTHGIGALVERFREKGLGGIIDSWVGRGENESISADQIVHGLGPKAVEAIAVRLGLNPEQVSALLAQVLPGVVDRLTPHGTVEAAPVQSGSEASSPT